MTPLKFYVNWLSATSEEDFSASENEIDGYMQVMVDIDHPSLDPEKLDEELVNYWQNPEKYDQPYIIKHR